MGGRSFDWETAKVAPGTKYKRARFQLPARVFRSIYPLIQKHAALRGISTSKLVNDILTIWLYNATPRQALRYFNDQHTPEFRSDKGPRSKALQALQKVHQQKRDEARDLYLSAQRTRPSAYTLDENTENVKRKYTRKIDHHGHLGFPDSAYVDESQSALNPNLDHYGVDYSLPPFPKDMPPGYLKSIGWQGDIPISDIGAWLKWAATDGGKMPL